MPNLSSAADKINEAAHSVAGAATSLKDKVKAAFKKKEEPKEPKFFYVMPNPDIEHQSLQRGGKAFSPNDCAWIDLGGRVVSWQPVGKAVAVTFLIVGIVQLVSKVKTLATTIKTGWGTKVVPYDPGMPVDEPLDVSFAVRWRVGLRRK